MLQNKLFCIYLHSVTRKCSFKQNAKVAQLVERNLAKVEVASSNLVFRSNVHFVNSLAKFYDHAEVVELVDTQDLKSCSP